MGWVEIGDFRPLYLCTNPFVYATNFDPVKGVLLRLIPRCSNTVDRKHRNQLNISVLLRAAITHRSSLTVQPKDTVQTCTAVYYSAPDRGVEYCNKRVCFSLREHISGTTRPIFTKFLCMLPMAGARSSSGGVAICYVKGSPYFIIQRRVPELVPVLGSQPAGDVSH